MPRELVRAPNHDRKRSLGWLAWAWVEHFCIHGPGDVQGVSLGPDDPNGLPLDDEFGGFLVDCYALDPKGRRLYDDAFISRAKGRAKSELAAFAALFEAFGPCRFAGWAEGGEQFTWHGFSFVYEPGDPMGRPVTYPFIRCLATEEGQAGNTYDNIHFNLDHGPLSEDLPKDANGLTRVFLPGGGEIRPSTASNSAKDGGKETFVVFDETHLYVQPELQRMYATVGRNKAKRKAASPWSLQTSTMYQTGQDSTAEKTHKRAQLIREGRSRERRLLFDHREAPVDVDMTSRKAIVAALTEVYGPFAEAMDLDGMVDREFWNTERDPEDSLRYFFNQPTSHRDALVNPHQYEACEVSDRHEDGDQVTLGFDGGKTDDATALIVCRMRDRLTAPLDLGGGRVSIWESPGRGSDWEIDRLDVEAAVERAFERFKVIGFYADLALWESYVDKWSERWRGKLRVKASPTSSVGWDMRGRLRLATIGTERLAAAIRDGEFKHTGDPTMRRHFLNARKRPNNYGMSFGKESRESPNKVDAFAAAQLADMARHDLIEKGWKAQNPNAGRVVVLQ